MSDVSKRERQSTVPGYPAVGEKPLRFPARRIERLEVSPRAVAR